MSLYVGKHTIRASWARSDSILAITSFASLIGLKVIFSMYTSILCSLCTFSIAVCSIVCSFRDRDATGPDICNYYIDQLNKCMWYYQPQDYRAQPGPEPKRASTPIPEGPFGLDGLLEGKPVHLESAGDGVHSKEQEDIPQLMITYEGEGIFLCCLVKLYSCNHQRTSH